VVGVQPEHVVVDIASALAGEVPVAVVRQVEHRRLVGRGVVVDPQLVSLRERVRHVDAQRAGIALLAVRARVVQLQADTAVAGRDDRRRPHLVVKPFDAAVREDLDHHPFAVIQRVALDGDSAGSRSERLAGDAGVAGVTGMAMVLALPSRRDGAGEANHRKHERQQHAADRDAAKWSSHFCSSFSPLNNDCRRSR
jgi:hypothetical protein